MRTALAAAVCAGAAMLGAAVHGIVGVDAELQRSAIAAERMERSEPRFVHFRRDCPAPPARRQLS
jgi:hypothetical protein